MSMQLVGGIAGAAVGSMFGMPQIGWMLGSMIGGTFEPTKNTQGPRLGDTRVQLSTYGKPIPQIFGTARIAGNVFWSTGLLETAHTSSGGGKGGGGGTSQTTYTYAASFAVGLCSTTSPDGTNTPIAGIGRIWADGQLIANFGSFDPNTIMASYATGGGKNGAGVGYQASGGSVLYTGGETQNPDPTMQAYLGAANVPAYRGQAYIVFNNFQLQKFGNRIPNIEVEVINSGAFSSSLTLTSTGTGTAQIHPIGMSRVDSTASYILVSGQNSAALSLYSLVNQKSPIYMADIDPAVGNNPDSFVFGTRCVIGSHTGAAKLYDCVSRTLIASTSIAGFGSLWLDKSFIYGLDINSAVFNIAATSNGATVARISTPMVNPQYMTVAGNYAYIAGNATICAMNVSNPANPYLAWSFSIGAQDIVSDGVTLFFRVMNTIYAYKINGDSLPTLLSTVSVFSYAIWRMSLSNGYIFCGSSSNGMSVVDARNPSSMSILLNQALPLSSYSAVSAGRMFYFAGYPAYSRGNLYAYFLAANVISASQTTASAIAAKLCAQVGVTSLDTSQINDVVDGYIVGSQMTARAAIEPLQKAFYFDGVETDNVIRFAKRGIQPTTIIPEDDLGAHSPQTKTIPASINLSHAQEIEIPALVNVAYYNSANAYQQGAQYSKRQTVASRQTLDLQLPICMTDAHAKQVADVNLFMAWTQKNTVAFSTTRKYAYLDPSDVVQVTRSSGATYTLLLTKRTEAAGGLINWEAVVDDASVYGQIAAPSSGLIIADTTVPLIGNTRIEFLDIPLLRDADDATGSGYYTAAGGYDSTWAGGALFKSTDAGLTYTSAGGLPSPGAVMGLASNALGNFASGNIFDENNSVTVVIDSGQLSSVTELQVLNGANAAVIGNEIIQFKNATLTAANTYTLSGLLRGRFGTEHHQSVHAIGDRFVLLDTATVQRQSAAINEIGLSRTYKAATLYQLLSDCIPVTFTDNGAGLKPLSPVKIGGGRDASGNLTINWIRRSRVGGGWNNFSDVPLGETSESYSIDIMAGAVVKRTLTSATPTVSYTSAMQVADFGSNQASVTVNVYQISATIGRGFAGISVV